MKYDELRLVDDVYATSPGVVFGTLRMSLYRHLGHDVCSALD